ncbi:MAG: ABC transporter substrate-binding protein [Deltaproteobacteria bacterium]|nr:ABC transporter substrate-binding protein [Deltaproteobacteria bacterium]MBI2227852.1 ABC transporter substrate-binding protein [Deltaproteobacteria bacterium]MBI2366404.1 ABC transporter substrate-binding protein [Deltaproteobacteria bacterium]
MRALFGYSPRLYLALLLLLGSLPDSFAQTAAPEKALIAVPSPALSMLPVFFAQDRGLFKKEGIEPVLVMMSGRLQAIALGTGEIDYAASVETILRSTMQGMPFKIILYTNSKMSVVLVTSPDIKSVADLRGKAVGVTSLGGGLEYALREILIQQGKLNPDRDVRAVSLGMPEQMAGLAAGSLHGAMLVPPYDAIMARKGYRRLVSAVDLLEYPQGGIATTDKKIKERPAQVKRIMRAMIQALNDIRGERERTVSYIATRWKIDQELAAQSYDIMVRSFSKDGSASAKSIQNVIDSTRSRLQIDRAISVNDVAAFSLLGEVQKELSLR